jgi:hypothetical protein
MPFAFLRVDMEGNFGPFEDHQQLGHAGVEAREQAIEGGEASALLEEDTIKPRSQRGPATG